MRRLASCGKTPLAMQNGVDVELQDESGGRLDGVDDPRGILNKLLAEPGDRDDDYPFLRSIDAYGDTTFNRVSVPATVPV
jgi:hypothetical protein